jgi:hypothetical protein
MDRLNVQNGKHFSKMRRFVIWEEERKYIFDIKFIDPRNTGKLEMTGQVALHSHLNRRTSHSMTFPVGASIKYGPSNFIKAAMFRSSSSFADAFTSVLSMPIAASENRDFSKFFKYGFKVLSCNKPLIPRA